MSEATPHKSDAILGGQTPPPTKGAILGGLAGAEQRLKSESSLARLTALRDGFQYGDRGIDLAVQALQDDDWQVHNLACRLLREEGGDRGKQLLLEHEPLRYFKTFRNWRLETYNPATGIVDPHNNAYAVCLETTGGSSRNRYQQGSSYDLSQFEALLQDPRVAELEALVFQIACYDRSAFGIALEAICDAKESFPNLNALFVGDREGDRAPAFRKSKLSVFDIRPFLESFPELEVLQVFGSFGCYDDYILECAGFQHEHLKTLIIETADIIQPNINQLCSMNLPELEYFELWFGRKQEYTSAAPSLQPIFDGHTYPKLKYLGLCSSEEIGSLFQQLITSPLMSKLIALDLNMSGPDDEGYYEDNPHLDLQPFRNPEIVKNLQILNLSGLSYGSTTIAELSQNIPHVIAFGQDGGYFFEDYTQETLEENEESYRLSRHWALYE